MKKDLLIIGGLLIGASILTKPKTDSQQTQQSSGATGFRVVRSQIPNITSNTGQPTPQVFNLPQQPLSLFQEPAEKKTATSSSGGGTYNSNTGVYISSSGEGYSVAPSNLNQLKKQVEKKPSLINLPENPYNNFNP
jgi:hypothetical protein